MSLAWKSQYSLRTRWIALAVVSVLVLVAGWIPSGLLPRAVAATGQLTDADSAADLPTAQAIAKQFGHPVTVEPNVTETSLVQALPDGTMQLDQSTEPVRVPRGAGWVPLDTTLVSNGDTLEPAAPAVPTRFSTGGSLLAQIQAPSGEWLSETWQGGNLPAPNVSGNSATYPEVFPGVDLRLSATASGMAEVLIVKDPGAQRIPALTKSSSESTTAP